MAGQYMISHNNEIKYSRTILRLPDDEKWNRGMLQQLSVTPQALHVEPAPEVIFKPLPQDDPLKRKPDITMAKKFLDWEPQVSLEEGLTKTISYFKEML